MSATASPWTIGAIAAVCVLTVLGGAVGLRWSRTTSDFYVASRVVTPGWNASAIGGEYLSGASFLGVAGLIYAQGLDMLWFPIGYTLGYLFLLVLVAAPLRRSGAYTLPDFAEARLQSRRIRALCSVLVVLVGWFYLVPQMHGAGLALHTLTGAPPWLGSLLVTILVTIGVVAGGMKSVTLVQAAQYWVKLIAIAVPACLLVWLWFRHGQPAPAPASSPNLALQSTQSTWERAYFTYSLLIGLCLGTMGLPHVVVRYYTNPNGRAARHTTVAVVGLLGIFYLFPPLYGVLGRAFLPVLPPGGTEDAIVLLLPGAAAPGLLGDLMTAIVAAGAFAAFLSTASGLAVCVGGVLNQDVIRPLLTLWTRGDADTIHGFRISAALAMSVPFLLVLGTDGFGLATMVGMAFGFTASTFCPMLVLGVWWRRLSVPGAAAGLVVGAVTSGVSLLFTVSGVISDGTMRTLLNMPAAWTVPLAFLVMILVSLATPERIPSGTWRTLVRLHTPESAGLTPEH